MVEVACTIIALGPQEAPTEHSTEDWVSQMRPFSFLEVKLLVDTLWKEVG